MPTHSKHAWPEWAKQSHANDAAKSPVSKGERDMLEKFRATPVLETVLTPSGNVAVEVVRDGEAQREARIGYINKRLGRQYSRARDGFNRSQ